MLEWSDEQLVSGFRDSADMSCFEQLVERHAAGVRAAVVGMVRSDADADDITQEVFIRVARGLARFGGRATFKTWLYRIVMNTTRSFLRGRTRRIAVIPDRHDDLPESPGGVEDRPDRRAMARELGQHVEEAIESLPLHLREALVMVVLEGHDVAETARIEGCTRATMYWRVHQARRLLRAALAERNHL